MWRRGNADAEFSRVPGGSFEVSGERGEWEAWRERGMAGEAGGMDGGRQEGGGKRDQVITFFPRLGGRGIHGNSGAA